MATIAEANAIADLVGWIIGDRNGNPRASERAREAAEYLAGRSYKVLMAGVRPERVAEVWRPGDDVPSLMAKVQRQRDALDKITEAHALYVDGEFDWQDTLKLIGKIAREVEP